MTASPSFSDSPGVSTASRTPTRRPAPTRRRLDYMPLTEVLEADVNPKRHDGGGIAASLARFGYVEPIALDERTGRLVAGHGRLEQLRALRERAGKTGRGHRDGTGGPPDGVVVEDGQWFVPVVRGWSSADDAEADAYLIASNRLSERGGWDEGALAALLADLEQADPTLPALAGFADVEVAALLERLAAVVDEPPTGALTAHEAPPAPDAPLSRVGEVITLGPHTLVVGDAGDPAVLTAAMAGARAAVLWTDPPYGVDYVGKTPRHLTIASDTPGAAVLLFARTLEAIEAAGALLPGAAFYVCHPPGVDGIDFQHLLRQPPWRFAAGLVWVKDALVLGHSDHHYRHEPIATGDYVPVDATADDVEVSVRTHELIGYGRYVPGGRTPAKGRGRGGWYGGHAVTTVFEVPRPKSSRLHPTMKPLDLITAHLRNVTRRGQHVLDTFAGSGTTVLAAHALGLIAHVVELEPAYADVVASRFQHVTGITPTVDGVPRSYPRLDAAPEATTDTTAPAEAR